MSDAAFLSEAAKVKQKVNTRATWQTHNSVDNPVAPITRRTISCGSADFTTASQPSYIASSTIYRRVYNMGGGQFAAASRHYFPGANKAEVYCKPFKINQTTGAITEGTGAAAVTVTSGVGNNIDTGTFSQAGTYIMTQHTSPGLGTNSVSAFRVNSATNSVAVAINSTLNGSFQQPQNNFEAPTFFDGTTMYHYTQSYNTATGSFHRGCYSFNGSTIAMPGNETTTSVQAYSNIWPVRHQFGQANQSPTTGAGLRVWRSSAPGILQYDLLNTSGGYAATGNFQALGYGLGSFTWDGAGLELSNGRQLFYAVSGDIFLRNGNTLTDVTTTADYWPKARDWSLNNIYPYAQDTWVAVTNSAYELVKFYVNPLTYKITILEAFQADKFFQVMNTGWTVNSSHISFTGTSNQFMVATMGTYDMHVGNSVWVWNNPFSA